MFTIEILKCHKQKIGVTPHFAGNKPAENKITRSWWNVPRRHSLEAYSGFLHLPTANGSKFWPNAPSAIIYMAVTLFYVFLNPPKEVDCLNQKTQGIQRRFLDFLYQNHGFSQFKAEASAPSFSGRTIFGPAIPSIGPP